MAKRWIKGSSRYICESNVPLFHPGLVVHGNILMYGPPGKEICIGGTYVDALLVPESIWSRRNRGSPTNINSLPRLMPLLHSHSTKVWKAGHLLNHDLGGSGVHDDNLTPLTATANSNHSTFEDLVKNLIDHCDSIDSNCSTTAPQNDAEMFSAAWYGVRYSVVVSADRYSSILDPDDIHSYAFSHITATCKFVRLPKFSMTPTSQYIAHEPSSPTDYEDIVTNNYPISFNPFLTSLGRYRDLSASGLCFSVRIDNEA